MSDIKELAKLVKLCRKLGVKSYKTSDFEFELQDIASDYKPTTRNKKQLKADDSNYTSDSLPEESLLFWSSGGDLPMPKAES